jgi:hypothetical protein
VEELFKEGKEGRWEERNRGIPSAFLAFKVKIFSYKRISKNSYSTEQHIVLHISCFDYHRLAS